MLAGIKPICKKTFMRRDGTSIIFIQYCYSKQRRTLLNTGIAIPAIYWNSKSRRINTNLPASHGYFQSLNDELQRSIRLAEDILSFAIKNKITNRLTFLKKSFKPGADLNLLPSIAQGFESGTVMVNLDFFYQLDAYINFKTRNVTLKRAYKYHNLKVRLQLFEKFRNEPISFGAFDFNFYEAFVNYLRFDHIHRARKTKIYGLRDSTIGGTIKQLRTFLRNRMRYKIIPFINLEDYKCIDEASDAIYLTRDEVIKMYKVDLSNSPKNERARDLFVFGCLTGLRFSDYSSIEPDDLRSSMLYKKQSKVGHWVVIPLKEEAEVIFARQFNRSMPAVHNSSFNKEIKEVAKMAGINQLVKFSYKRCNKDVVVAKPKYEWVTSHTCRRSFCTNEFLAGTPVELIMKISGHKSVRDFYKYIKITPEEAAYNIKKIWQDRGEMQLIKS